MKEEVIPFFTKDIHSSCSFSVQTTPHTFSIDTPSVIICSHSSVVEKISDKFHIKTEIENQHYTPDINKFFNSFSEYAHLFDTDVIVMTGIGCDGVLGAEALKKSGAKIYAQDEKSSPVYGMPKAVCEKGIVDKVLSFEELKEYFRNL